MRVPAFLRLLPAAFLLTSFLLREAAALEPTRSPSEYKIDEWVRPPHQLYPAVRAMGQDKEGYLWFGTRTGMARFDGVALTPFRRSNLPVMPDSGVQAIVQDAKGVFWVGSEKGLLSFQNNRWIQIDAGFSEPIVALLCEPDGLMWAATNGGVYQVRGDKLEPYPTPGISFTAIWGMARCTTGDILVFGSPTILIREGRVQLLGRAQGMSHDHSTAAAPDRAGGVWIGTSRGLHHYKDGAIASFSTKDGLPVNAIRSLLVDRDNNLWIGTTSGLTRWTNGKFEDLHVRGDERLGHILSLFEDREGNIWLGSDTGFARLTDVAFSHLTRRQGLLSDSVTCIIHAKDGSGWVSTLGGGVTHFSSQGTRTFQPGAGLLDDTVVSMKEDGLGGLWFGYLAHGLTHYRDGKFTHYFAQPDAERNYWVVDVATGGEVWVANRAAGLMRFNGTAFENVSCPGLVQPRIVAIDRQGVVWVAGTNGAGRFQNGAWRFLPRPAASLADRPVGIIVDPEDGIWVLLDGAEIHRHTERGAALVAFDVAEVGPLSYGGMISQGEFWVNFRFGLLRVTVEQLTAVMEGRTKSPAYVLYSETGGMRSRAPNLAGFPSVSADQAGRIWSTTSRGVAIIDPRKIPFNPLPPKVVIERVLIDKVESPVEELQRIPPGRGELAFQYTALSLTESSRIQFKHRLIGFESAWSEPSRSRETYYGGLPPGRYRFEVLGSNNDGVWSTQPAALDVRLLPFFYQRTGFQILGGILLVAGVMGLVKWRVRIAHGRAVALQEQNTLLEKHIAERTAELAGSYDALRTSQRELFEASRMAGIAEMATGVLHNIGNALNSVRTSSGMAGNAIHQIRSAGIVRLRQLFAEQGERIGDFLLHDPRGRQVPEYLETIAGHIDGQKSKALGELAALEEAVGEVSQIVAAQQSLARTAGVEETVATAELIDAALRITDTFLVRSHLKVYRELGPVPAVRIDRQKALQILVCLVRNAERAMEAVDEQARQIIVGVRSPAAGWVTIYVSDAGLGIAPENLTRIFAMGFAKTPGDYGFGIHNSAVAAKELGGALTVKSGGPGLGATFELQLPSARNEAPVPEGQAAAAGA